MFYYDDGKDYSQWFASEEGIITEIDSFFKQEGSIFYLETIEDSTLSYFTLQGYYELLMNFPEFKDFVLAFTLKSLVEVGDRLKDLQFRNAKQRYQFLLEQHPTILQRVPLGHIASYLGITQQSLSRIRSKM